MLQLAVVYSGRLIRENLKAASLMYQSSITEKEYLLPSQEHFWSDTNIRSTKLYAIDCTGDAEKFSARPNSKNKYSNV